MNVQDRASFNVIYTVPPPIYNPLLMLPSVIILLLKYINSFHTSPCHAGYYATPLSRYTLSHRAVCFSKPHTLPCHTGRYVFRLHSLPSPQSCTMLITFLTNFLLIYCYHISSAYGMNLNGELTTHSCGYYFV